MDASCTFITANSEGQAQASALEERVEEISISRVQSGFDKEAVDAVLGEVLEESISRVQSGVDKEAVDAVLGEVLEDTYADPVFWQVQTLNVASELKKITQTLKLKTLNPKIAY